MNKNNLQTKQITKTSTTIIAKNKPQLPKAFIIKIEDCIPRRLYKNLLEQNTLIVNQYEISNWYISNRQHCVLYLQKLCEMFNLRENSYFAALHYADRLMRNSQKISTKEFDLKIIACFLLASKYVENEAYNIDYDDFVSFDQHTMYKKEDIKKYEVRCLIELDYELNESTAYDFLICQMACGVIFKDEAIDKASVNAFVNYAKKLLLQTTNTHLTLLYTAETIALCVIQYCRIHFNYKQERITAIKAKLEYEDDDEYELCFDYLNE